MNGGQFVVSYPDPMQALLIIGLLVFVVFAVAGHWLRIYFSWVEECLAQLRNFSLEETQSFCCSVNHSDESGNIIICDRKIIMTCIRSWFGSEEHFEASVRSDVFAACVQGLGRQAFPFSWYLGMCFLTCWAFLDLAVARLRAEEYYYASVGLVNWLAMFPGYVSIMYSCSLVVAYKLRRRWSNALVDYMVTLMGGFLILLIGLSISALRDIICSRLVGDLLLGMCIWALCVIALGILVAWAWWKKEHGLLVHETKAS